MNRKIKIGIAGGSFNPIHLGHLIIIEQFRLQMQLDKVKIIPAAVSPFKISQSTDYLPDTDRINIINAAIADNQYFELETYELEKEGVSYTIDTLHYLTAKYPDSEFYLLIGEDQAKEFNKWREWVKIAELAQICIAPRNTEGFNANIIEDVFGNISRKPIIVNSPLIEISSTNIRNKIKFGESIKYLVPNSVDEYIRQNNLYR